MVESTKENGSTIIWTVSEFIPGKMVENTKASIKMIRNMASESMFGVMVVCIEEIGSRVNSTAWAYIQFLTKVKSLDFGRMVKE
jgi:hypothetical protein